jgi:surface antigen
MKKITVLSCFIALTACADGNIKNVNLGGAAGTVVGALAGGMVGAKFGGGLGQTLFMWSGAAVGASVGYEAGNILYPSDQMAYDYNARQALASSADGTVSKWANPETGNGGIFTPTQTYITGTGRSCRDYRATLALKNDSQKAGIIAHQNGTACEQADGTWSSVAEDFG